MEKRDVGHGELGEGGVGPLAGGFVEVLPLAGGVHEEGVVGAGVGSVEVLVRGHGEDSWVW